MRNALAMLVMLLAFTESAIASSTATEQASVALESWAPKSITINNKGALAIVLPQRRITDQIYKAAILYGFCAVGVAGNGFEYPDVKEVVILNQFKAQGYVFEGSAKECHLLNELSGKAQEIELLSRTHLF